MKPIKSNIYIVVICLFFFISHCQKKEDFDFPIEEYKQEIQKLKKEDYSKYWKKLIDFDQNILMNETNYKVYDSLSMVSLIKSALLYEIKGDSIFYFGNSDNEFFFAHNHIPKANIDFWPLLMKQKEITGDLIMYPSYQLEGLSYSFYDYSLSNQDSIYDNLLSKIKSNSNKKISENLLDTYKEIKRIQNLSIKSQLGTWYRKKFKKRPNEKGKFELLELSDDNYYLRYDETRFKPLEIIKKDNNNFIFKTKYEPFGWNFILRKQGDLSLNNEKGKVLINYQKVLK